MGLKFKCTNCNRNIVVQFLTPGDPARCPYCSSITIVSNNAILTDEKSTILMHAISRRKTEPCVANGTDVILTVLLLKSKLSWNEILAILKNFILMIRCKYFIPFYFYYLFLNLVLIIIIKKFLNSDCTDWLMLTLFFVLLSILYISAYLLQILILKNLKNKEFISVISNVKTIISLFPKILAVNFIVGICVTFGIILFLLPGVTLFIYFIFVNQIVLIEKASVIGTLKKSMQMVNKNFWKLLFSVCIFYIAIFLLRLLMGTYHSFSRPDVFLNLSFIQVIYFLLATFLGLLFQIFLTLLYIHISDGENSG